MKINFVVTIFSLFGMLSSCDSKTKNKDFSEDKNLIIDMHTLSNYQDLPILNTHLELSVNFQEKKLKGSVTHRFDENRKADLLKLDTKYLKIDSIQDGNGNSLEYSFGEFDELLGSALSVILNSQSNEVVIFYETTNKSEALDWLLPNQTAGKTFPFMYTQGQSIFTRSWIPIQDTPGLRITYSAKINTPENMMAVMSAANPQEMDTNNVYSFKMNQPIPPYLIALAVGNLEFKAIDYRTGVYAEPSMVEECANELIDMGKMVDVAEQLYGKYDWDRYDVIVLPPSFPFGGMENPRLTFATPTIIAGDRSLVSLIAHELAHSWSGNLVTNATWNDFWLNEGFTVYFERRIMEALYGRDYSEMLALLGFQDLQNQVDNSQPAMQLLRLNMKGKHPDDAMTDIAYEKGYFFLRMLEENIGRDKMDEFLKKYFNDHKFQTIVTEEFLSYLKENLLDDNFKGLNVEQWVFDSGIPKNCPKINSLRFKNVESSVATFLDGGAQELKVVSEKWSTHEWLHFLKHLPESLSLDQMEDLDKVFNLSNSGNSEIVAVWFLQSIKNDYRPAFENLEKFLVKIGRRKFLQPLYLELSKNQEHKIWAKKVYQKARNNYHYVSFNTIDNILN
ncbi:MAG: M1 family metallopeptidase [Flavobacteriales bacterium]|nr:M1 family metallopeptidase [Flavobacteriales bacterium]